jgi:hypothetical protein
MIGESRLADFLTRQGYRLVTFASGYTGTELKNADVRLAPLWQLSEFQDMLLGTTMLAGLSEIVANGLQNGMHAALIRYTLRTIPHASQGHGPAFVFAHVVCPHTPFVFDAQGSRPKTVQYLQLNSNAAKPAGNRGHLREWYVANYGPQVQYLDVLVSETVERILADSTREAVVILQGDHGPHHRPEEFGILNAICVPPAVVRNPQAPALYDSITPVNTFRVLLSQLFDTSMALLPDRSYSSSPEHPYDLHLVARPDESGPQSEPARR